MGMISTSDYESVKRTLIGIIDSKVDPLKKKIDSLEKQNDALMEYVRGQIRSSFELYSKEYYELKRADNYNHFFSNVGGFLSSFARIWGYANCYLGENKTIEQKVIERLIGKYIDPIRNLLIILQNNIRKYDLNQNEMILMDIEKYEIETTVDFNLLQERLKSCRERLEEAQHNMNPLFYENLWKNVKPFVLQIEQDYFENLQETNVESARAAIMEYVYQLKDVLEQAGVLVIDGPSGLDVALDWNEYFLESDSVNFTTPLIMRKEDHFVYAKGIISLQ